MLVFLTGATGFIGSRIVPQLLAAGHQVLGMSRSPEGARLLSAAGAQVHRADISDLPSLRAGAALADAVIHTAFSHDFSRFAANCEQDRAAIGALGEALTGSPRPLVITSSVGMGKGIQGELALETRFNADHLNPRVASELAANALLERGVDVRVVRLPQVHDMTRQGLVSPYIEMCRQLGLAGYVGDGGNRWSAAHVDDVALLYRLVLERGQAGSRYHAVAEEGVPYRQIADVVARGLEVRTRSIAARDQDALFGWFGLFVGMDMAASSQLTRQWLDWDPVHPGLIEDLSCMNYTVPS